MGDFARGDTGLGGPKASTRLRQHFGRHGKRMGSPLSLEADKEGALNRVGAIRRRSPAGGWWNCDLWPLPLTLHTRKVESTALPLGFMGIARSLLLSLRSTGLDCLLSRL
jgi:hypothetical protein